MAERLTTAYLQSGNTPESSEEIVLDLVQSIELKKLKLLDFVQSLGDYLTDTDASLRSRATHLLQEVLSKISTKALSAQQVEVMIQFFADRLSDDVCLFDGIVAINSLAKMTLFTDEDAIKTCAAVFGINEDAQKHPQRTRFQIYNLIDTLMLRKRKALKEYGADFIVGFSGLMNGEKDPRNLMLAFSIMKVIITEFHIVSQVVDLFDVVYCYFPITFRPPKDEPSAITTEDLKLRLRECLSANHQFAPYLVPALIEKLNAVALSVKKDTLQTIAACCRNWSGRTLDTYANQIWNSIKYEISLSEDPEVESAALEVVTAITASFGKGLSEMSKNSDLSRWLQPIIVEAVEQLKEPELKNARSCGKTLKACSIAGPLAFDVVSHATVPGLLAICEETDNINRKTSLIEILIHILDAATLVYGSIADTVLAGSDCALVFVKDEILALLSKNLFGTPKVEGEFRKLALRGLVKALYVQKFLNEKEREMIVRYLGDILVEESGEMAEEALKALIGITPVRPGAILENTFPTLLSRLPEQCLDTGSTKLANLVLSALARLSVERSTFDTLIVRLFSRLDSSLSHNDGDSNLPKALLSTLLQVTRKKSEDDPKGLAKYYDRIVPAIFQRTIGSLSFDGSKAMVQPEILEINAEIVNLVTRVCEPEQQRDYAADVFSLYVTGGMNGLVKHLSDDFKPFDPQASEYQRNTIVLFVALYAALSRDIPIASVPNVAFLSRIIDFGNAASNGGQRLAARRLIALILNKCASESELSDLLSPSAGLFPPSTDRIKSSSLHTMIWVAKALVLRNHKDSRNLVLRLVDLLPDPEFGREAAESIETLIGDDMMLSKENHAVVKLLHRQKFFAYCVPDLMQRMGLVRSDLRTNYLVALSLIVGSVPKEVYMTEAATLLPVLIQCLESPESRLKISACNTLLVILVESKDLVAQHLSSLVPLLLASLRVSEVSTPTVRVQSLKLLGAFTISVRGDKLQPFKARVLKALGESLDDPKRAVRKEVVDCRHRWYQ